MNMPEIPPPANVPSEPRKSDPTALKMLRGRLDALTDWLVCGILGALFNTRGLLVLVAGLIGLQFKIITNLTFTIIVIVALVTNLMTVPLLDWISARQELKTPSQGVTGMVD